MKALNIAVTSLLLIAGESFAASTVSDVVARQRWPWSGKVDIDYTVTGDKTDVDFYATWDGQTTPVLIGTDFQIEAGQHRFEFDPALSGFAGKTTTGFAVTASPAGADAHKYLVLDLVNGGYTYRAAPPEGGWTTEHKSTKMVFARIPAGTSTLGYSSEMLDHLYGDKDAGDNPHKIQKPRTVTFTSDFYVGVYKFTDAQYQQLVNGSPSSTYTPKVISYYKLRGVTNQFDSVEDVDWPKTGYKVAEDSIVNQLRVKSNGLLRIDLCEEEQWEYAARCKTSTYWPNGGVLEDSLATLTNTVSEIASWYYDTMPSVPKIPNQWGMYDIVSGGAEWTLNCSAWVNTGTGKSQPRSSRTGGTDVVGPLHSYTYSDYDSWRVMKSTGGNYKSVPLYAMGVAGRTLADPANNYAASTRFCVHLKPLDLSNPKY